MRSETMSVRLLQPAILCLLALWIAGCSDSDGPETTQNTFIAFNGPTMGTWYNVKIQDVPDNLPSDDIKAAIEEELENVNRKMSTYRSDSELSLFNSSPVNTPMALSADTAEVVAISQQVYQESGGAFDVTVGPLVNLWGFGPGAARDQVPEGDEISELLQVAGMDALQLDADQLTKSRPVSVDLSAVAKGYAVDRVAQRLEALGITRYMVEVGGETRVGEAKVSGETWKIAIEEPKTFTRSIQKVLGLESVSLATSGNYRNFFEQDGVRYSHTIDPRTGAPVRHQLASVTVVHPSCAYADAYATALLVLGPDEALAFAEERNLAVYLLVQDGDGFKALQSESFAKYVESAAI